MSDYNEMEEDYLDYEEVTSTLSWLIKDVSNKDLIIDLQGLKAVYEAKMNELEPMINETRQEEKVQMNYEFERSVI